MNKLTVFTDGASRGNPGPAGWGAVLRIGRNREAGKVSADGWVEEVGGHLNHGTNNEAELTAVCNALEYAQSESADDVVIYTDSSYVGQGATNWVFTWQENGWQTSDDQSVKNKTLWQKLVGLQADRAVTYKQVPGHAGVPANERADMIATAFAANQTPDLYDGPADGYDISFNPEPKLIKNAPVYLSLVNGQVRQHNSWEDCESRVSGEDAKFRKVRTVAKRDKLLADWGKLPTDIEN
jgi:ribonuclease HI